VTCRFVVGVAGFEPAASSSRSQRAMWPTTTLTPSDLPRTVRGRPLASAGVCGDCYSVSYSPPRKIIPRIPRVRERPAPAGGTYGPVVQTVGFGDGLAYRFVRRRPSAKAAHTPSRCATLGHRVLSPPTSAGRWLLLLLTPLLSAQPRLSVGSLPWIARPSGPEDRAAELRITGMPGSGEAFAELGFGQGDAAAVKVGAANVDVLHPACPCPCKFEHGSGETRSKESGEYRSWIAAQELLRRYRNPTYCWAISRRRR
jgi:hypothetical protein